MDYAASFARYGNCFEAQGLITFSCTQPTVSAGRFI